jgi:carbon monoxide dehydrogenase subunit G
LQPVPLPTRGGGEPPLKKSGVVPPQCKAVGSGRGKKRRRRKMKRRMFRTVLVIAAIGLAGSLLGAKCEGARSSGMGFSTIMINASPEKIWSYLEDPNNEYEWDPAFRGLSDVQGSGVGQTSKLKTEQLGMSYECENVMIEWIPNQKAVMLNSCGTFEDMQTVMLAPQTQGTKLIWVMELSGELPAGMPYDVVRKALQKGMDDNLKRIKAAVEAK